MVWGVVITFSRLYLDILGKQRDVVSKNESRYRGGLQKLADTEKIVADLQDRLNEMKPVLAKAAQETEDLLEVVANDQEEAAVQQEIVSKDVAEANKVAAEVQVRMCPPHAYDIMYTHH